MKYLAVLAFALALPVLLGAQQRTHASEKSDWNPAPVKFSFQRAGYFGFSQQQQVAFRAGMARVMEQLHRTPVLDPPKGYCANVFATLCEYDCEGRKLLTGESTVIFLEYTRKGNDPKIERDPEGPSLKLYFNMVSRLVTSIGLDSGAYFEEPYITGYAQGFPIYGSFVAITRGQEPVFVPITRENYLKAEIKQAKQRLEDIKKSAGAGSPYQQWLKTKDESIKGALEGFEWAAKTDPVKAKADKEKYLRGMQQTDSMYKAGEAGYLKEMQAMIDKAAGAVRQMQDELAGLSPAQRTASVTSRSGRTYMQVNPAYFNSRLPASAIQLIVMDLFKYKPGHLLYNTFSEDTKYLLKTLQETVDLKQLQALLQ